MSILSISNPAALFIKLIFSYTLFFAAASVTENLTIKAIANVYAILVFFIMLLVWLNTDKPFQLPSRIGLGLIIINCGAILSIVINPNETNLVLENVYF
jgi:drug/metabolite transporter (DMT)-like permease